jgi:hypothetical protein
MMTTTPTPARKAPAATAKDLRDEATSYAQDFLDHLLGKIEDLQRDLMHRAWGAADRPADLADALAVIMACANAENALDQRSIDDRAQALRATDIAADRSGGTWRQPSLDVARRQPGYVKRWLLDVATIA